MSAFDLDAYLERIGIRSVRGATLETLHTLHAAHPAAIPFENLNPLLGWPVSLDPKSLQQKLVIDRRGGWCFEHNGLFQLVLEAVGFRVTTLGARVLWNAPSGSPVGARSHMLLRVEAEGKPYLCDVGFGGNVLTGPLQWKPGIEQQTPHEPHRIMPLENGLVLEAFIQNHWMPLYRFTEEAQFPADYEVSNWFLCTHASSFFRTTLLAARALPDRRYAVRNNELATHKRSGTEKQTFTNATELRDCLATKIGIHLPESPELDAALNRLCQPNPPAPA